jgi:hypothetical protein
MGAHSAIARVLASAATPRTLPAMAPITTLLTVMTMLMAGCGGAGGGAPAGGAPSPPRGLPAEEARVQGQLDQAAQQAAAQREQAEADNR